MVILPKGGISQSHSTYVMFKGLFFNRKNYEYSLLTSGVLSLLCVQPQQAVHVNRLNFEKSYAWCYFLTPFLHLPNRQQQRC